MKSRWMVVLGFLGAILTGALLLTLPCSTAGGGWLPFMDALFTACSAVCVTGLSVIEVGKDLSFFGQWVVVALVQLGCMGIMTFGTFFLIVAGRRISLSSEFSLIDAYGAPGVNGLKGLVVWVIGSMLACELAGMWAIREAAAGEMGWFKAFFYSAMTFCNAGFAHCNSDAAEFARQPGLLAVMSVLVWLGGIGFLVMYNLCTIRFWRRNLVKRGRLTLHSKVALTVTGALVAVAYAAFLALEWDVSLKGFGAGEKLGVALLQSVTPRTCGFSVVAMEDLRGATRFLMELLMFVGGAPGSAAGGIKVTTLAVFLVTLWAICRGSRDTVMFRRAVPLDAVRESIVIVTVFAVVISASMMTLLVTECANPKLTFERLLFETVSAIATTGLSIGDTTVELSAAGRWVIMACMFGGRIGALALVFLIGGDKGDGGPTLRYPKEELVVG